MKKFGKLFVFLLLAGTLFGCKKEVEEKEIVWYSYSASDYEGKDLTLENDDLLFELDHATTHFTVTQKSNGKVWYSNPVGATNDPLANATTMKYLQSPLIIEYKTDDDRNVILTTYEHSVSNLLYSVEKLEDAIKVNYTIGKVSKKYIIPPAVPVERMMLFYDKMEKGEKRTVDRGYRKIDINDLLPTDDKGALLEMYPTLENEPMYVLRDTAKDYVKHEMEGFFAAAGYTEEDYESDLATYVVSQAGEDSVYNISVIYRLEGKNMVVEVPNEEIEFKKDTPLSKIKLLPYFGCGSVNDEGYLFVPNGSGGVIDFNNGRTNVQEYNAQLYGFDYGNKREDFINETRAAFPVFGIAHTGTTKVEVADTETADTETADTEAVDAEAADTETADTEVANVEGAFIAIIDNFKSSANIQADVSARPNNHGFNYVHASYDMIHASQMDITGKSDKIILEFQDALPEGSIRQEYHFIDGTEYMDMAEEYRAYLMEKNPEMKKTTDSELPVAVEFVAAIDRVKQVVGIPVSRPEVLTSFDEAKEILESLLADGYTNLSVRYSGWLNGGVDHSLPKDIDLTSGMGGKKALDSFVSYAADNGIDLYLNGRVQNAYESNLFDGFVKSRDSAKYLSREVVEIPEFSKIWFLDLNEGRVEHHYLLRPSVCVSLMQSLADYAGKKNVGVGYEDVGYLLSGDYNKKRTVVREESMNMQVEKLAEVKASGVPIAVTAGNDYVVPYASLITEMDMEGNAYLIINRSIPFYQMAIHGLVSYTGDALNLGDDPVDMILKSAESGAGLSFAYISEDTSILQDTEYLDYFGATYDEWKDIAKGYYTRYKTEMAGLNNLFITDYKVLSEGVTATTYEDGTVVYVNFTLHDYSDGSLTISAKDYVVERSGD